MYTIKKKVKISNDLFLSIISFLENLDTDYFEQETIRHYGYVLHTLNNKKAALELNCSLREFANGQCIADTLHDNHHYADDYPF